MSSAPTELRPGQGQIEREQFRPVDGPLLPLVLDEAANSHGLRTILAADLQERGRVGDPCDPSKPFIIYVGMNGETPDSAVGVAALEIAISELGLVDTPIVFVGLASSGTWLADKRVIERLRRPDLVTVVPTTKNLSLADSWRAEGSQVSEFLVNPYVGGRGNGHYSERVPVFVRDPQRLTGAIVVGGDDVIAEGDSALGLHAGVNQWSPAEFYFAAILSKRVQGGVDRLRGTQGIRGVVEAIPVERVLGPGDGKNIVVAQTS